MAPKLFIPVPLIVRDSGILNPFPFIFKAVVLATVVVEAPVTPGVVLPKPSWFCNWMTPLEIVVAPE